MKFVFRRWKILLFLLVLIGGGIFWRQQQLQASKQELQTTTVSRGSLEKKIEVSGIIDAKEKAVLRFANGGKITYIGVKEGDWIKRYQTIARIDARELQKRLSQDLNVYFNQRLDFEQNKDDRGDTIRSTQEGRNAQTDQKSLENKVLDVEIRDIAIRNTALTSPIEGVLLSAPTTVAGINILPTDTFEIVNPSTLVFRAAVDEADIALVDKGQQTEIELDAYPDKKITTSVNYVSFRSAQSSTGTVFLVEMTIPLESTAEGLSRYRLGMNGDAEILVAKKDDVLTLPLEVTKERDGKTYVTLKTGPDSTRDQEIEVGLETDDKIEVKSGLSESDEVVIP